MKANHNSSLDRHSEVVQEITKVQVKLRGFVRSLFVKPADVEDLVQEVNIVLWEKADQYKSGTNFWAWASQIARFKVLNQIRSYGNNRYVFDDDFLEKLADITEERFSQIDQRRSALSNCLNRLPVAQRRLLDLRYFEDNSIDAISDITGRPLGSIKQTLYRIRSSLRNCISDKLNTSLEGQT